MLREYQNEINMLRNLLEKSNVGESFDQKIDIQEQIMEEKMKIEKEFEEKARNLRKEHEQQKKEKEELMQSNKTFRKNSKNRFC